MPSWRIFIPTRDSARWIGVFHQAYRALGVEPLYVVDARSRDDTLALLQSNGADVVVVTPEGDFVEAGMIGAGCAHAGTDWVLRMDDDEFPSRALLKWVQKKGVFAIRPFWQISRRELFRRDDSVFYSRRRSAYAHPTRPDFLSGQLRFHRARDVEFSKKIHSSGLDTIISADFAPSECFFIHCVDLLLNPAQRLAKILRYEAIEPGSAWRVADEYLPELFDDGDLQPAKDGIEEFSQLLKNLPAPEHAPIDIDDETRLKALSGAWEWTERISVLGRAPTASPPSAEFLRLIPRPAWRTMAKLLLTTGRFSRWEPARRLGDEIWNLADFYRV